MRASRRWSASTAPGSALFPGAIDPHLHLGHGSDISRPRVPADAAQESAAAAIGGITTFIPYLLSTEPFDAVFPEVQAVTEAGSRIDFGYHFIISTEAQLAGVPSYVERCGVNSFKIFMNNRGGEGARLGLPDIDDGFLFRLCEAAAASGAVVCPHPETIEIAWVLRAARKGAGSRWDRRLADVERLAPGFCRGRRGAALGLSRPRRRRPHLHRPHLVRGGARSRADAAWGRQRDHDRDLPALSHP